MPWYDINLKPIKTENKIQKTMPWYDTNLKLIKTENKIQKTMPWYDINLKPIESPPNKSCIHIQKPHTRTVSFYNPFYNEKVLYKQIKFPWTVFFYYPHPFDAFFAVSEKMPTLDSTLCRMKSPDICGFVCLEYFHEHYNENTPQKCLDYFWSSAFECDIIRSSVFECNYIPINEINIRYLVNYYHPNSLLNQRH